MRNTAASDYLATSRSPPCPVPKFLHCRAFLSRVSSSKYSTISYVERHRSLYFNHSSRPRQHFVRSYRCHGGGVDIILMAAHSNANRSRQPWLVSNTYSVGFGWYIRIKKRRDVIWPLTCMHLCAGDDRVFPKKLLIFLMGFFEDLLLRIILWKIIVFIFG